MHLSFYIVAGVTVASAIAAMSLRNIVHCALLLTVTFAGLALLYLQLNAQFVALAQVLVYIGAVAILIVFAILLTRSSDIGVQSRRSARVVTSAIAVAVAAFATIAKAIVTTSVTRKDEPSAALQFSTQTANGQQIGHQLMGNYVLPLEI